jgi:hypothetical protein
MKLLLENWRQYLAEQTELWGHHIDPEEKVFVSDRPYTSFRNVQQETPIHGMMKPKGLWYACGDSWTEFSKGAWDRVEGNYLYELELGDNVLQISTKEELDQFIDRFLVPGQFGKVLDWKKVQDEGYAGVEICPYNWTARANSLEGNPRFEWYYPWDVASGCIWDNSGVKDIKLLAERTDETPT